jgi:hypothetical protein
MAPELPQAVVAVLLRLFPETETPAALVHTTGWAPAGGGGEVAPVPITGLVWVAPVV